MTSESYLISNGEEFPESDGVRVVTELGGYAILELHIFNIHCRIPNICGGSVFMDFEGKLTHK